MEFLSQYGVIPIEYDVLLSHLGKFKYPRNKVSALVGEGKLIRLKKGLFVVSPEVSGKELSLEVIANHLYGPSYISYETALFYHGLIPERTITIKSATSRRKKKYDTPLGNFEYGTLPGNYFPIGITQLMVNVDYSFLIASPEKAICDQVLSTRALRLQSMKAGYAYIFQDLRLDLESGPKLNPEIVLECSEAGYKKKELLLIYNLLKNG